MFNQSFTLDTTPQVAMKTIADHYLEKGLAEHHCYKTTVTSPLACRTTSPDQLGQKTQPLTNRHALCLTSPIKIIHLEILEMLSK
jgi:hypothetical protein